MSIKGIALTLTEQHTGSTASFHRIEYFAVDCRANYVSLIVRGYVSQAAFDSGKMHIMETNSSIAQAPQAGDDLHEFLYRAITAEQVAAEVDPNVPHLIAPVNLFAGAQLVYDAPVAAQ